MLSRCRAYVAALTEPQNRSLVHLAERAGFGVIGTLLGNRKVTIETGDVVFFLVHHKLSDDTKRAILRRIRESGKDTVRYAPVVMVSPEVPPEVVVRNVRLGLDDIITLPKKREALVARLCTQLDTEHTYFETLDYVGPDRRRFESNEQQRDERRTGDVPYTRVTIQRSVDRGVRVVRREMVGRKVREPVLRNGYVPASEAAVMVGRF
jgi:PleD family two-component response regulator